MKTITAIIEKAKDGGVSVYSDEIPGSYGFGLSEEEGKADFISLLEECAEDYKERYGDYPEWWTEGYKISYKYDISGFFEAFPFINASQFAKALGVNGCLMRKYKGRMHVPSEKQIALIRERYADIVARLSAVSF